MTITAARRRRLSTLCELDAVHWIASEGSILIPEQRAVAITIGVRLQSQGQWSNNWRAAYGRTLALRKRVSHALSLIDREQVTEHLRGPVRKILFTRLAPRQLDTDNTVIVMKPARDQVCCWLQGDNSAAARANDGMRSGYTFSYHQLQQRLYGLGIELQP